jgi:tRNA(Arg) A34 adenosine deaminase TadA
MKEAIELAQQGMDGNHGGPFGAVVVKDGQIIGRGFNQVTSVNDPTAHAEVQAIRRACQKLQTYDLSGCEIYASCYPCPMCLATIYWSRIGKFYYGSTRQDAAEIKFDDDFFYQQLHLDPSQREVKEEQCCHDEAKSVMIKWLDKKDKTSY